MGVGRRADDTGMDRHSVAPGRERIDEAVKLVHGRTWRTSHQKCLVWGSRRGKEMVRTSDGAGLDAVRYE